MALINCGECGEEVSENADSCPECGNPISQNESDNMGCGQGCLALVGLLVGGLVLVLIIGGIAGNGNQGGGQKDTTSSKYSIGQKVELKHENAPELLARDSEAWDQLNEVMQAKDKVGLKKLLERRVVLDLQHDEKAKILDKGFTSFKVRITKGPHSGRAGWVYKEIITGN